VITVIEGLSIFELISSYCVLNNKCLLYFDNSLWSSFDEDKKNQILEFYSDYAPEDIIEELKQGRNCVIEYTSEDVAIMNASEWFPPKKYCPSPEYFFRCLVFDSSSDIVFENLDPSLTEPEE
jgi:hypothetical protein